MNAPLNRPPENPRENRFFFGLWRYNNIYIGLFIKFDNIFNISIKNISTRISMRGESLFV
jgi:hypothetical protein